MYAYKLNRQKLYTQKNRSEHKN